MKRGEVWWVNFDPSVGGEIQKQRPAVIVSSDTSNRSINRIQVVPLTSNVNRLYPSETYVALNGVTRKAMANQLTTASKQRFGNQIGTLSAEDMEKVAAIIIMQLDLA